LYAFGNHCTDGQCNYHLVLHDSKSLEQLLTRTEYQLYADLCPRGYKAYASAEHDKLLAKRNQPLNEQQKHQNHQWSSVRSTVERVFGILKQHYGIGKARYLGLHATKPASVGGGGLQHQARRGCAGQDVGTCGITPSNATENGKK
jgi:Transposase DDE domain